MEYYFTAFLGTVELFAITDTGEIVTLSTYPDYPGTREALVSLYGASEVNWASFKA